MQEVCFLPLFVHVEPRNPEKVRAQRNTSNILEIVEFRSISRDCENLHYVFRHVSLEYFFLRQVIDKRTIFPDKWSIGDLVSALRCTASARELRESVSTNF